MSKGRHPRSTRKTSHSNIRHRSADPRVLAARLLSRWQGIEASKRPGLNTLIQEEAQKIPVSRPEDRALLAETVSGSVRWLRLLTRIIDMRLKKPGKIPPVVKALLVTALYQILFLDRIPAFAAVNEAVKATRACGAAWASGVVNALLRQAQRDMEKGGADALISSAAGQAGDGVDKLATLLSYPSWMVERWVDQHGIQTAEQICRAGNRRPPLVLRVNRLKTSREQAVRLLENTKIHAAVSQISPDGIILHGFRGNPAGIPGFAEGWFQVQDESAQLVSLLLQCHGNNRILDACAGLGGKATHIAEITRDKVLIDAWDTSPRRLGLLKKNASRLGLKSINILSSHDLQAMREAGKPVYDRILVDAPCSGLGVIRRHPDIKWNRKPGDSSRLAATQASILDETAPLLKPGGILVYAVCTTEPEETLEVSEKFLNTHAGWIPADMDLPWLDKRYLTAEGFLRILPWEGGPDGFFAAAFQY